jgi:diadenosine tetraphosphatase ApaH/serine/threonine PP2A family protein phosphatase
MRVAILADIHANLEALEAVLEDAARQGCAKHAGLGDLIGFNADAVSCVDRLRDLDCPVVRGDFEETLSEGPHFENANPVAAFAFRRDWDLLGPQRRQWLRQLPLTLEMDGITLVHGSLDHPSSWHYVVGLLDAGSSLAYQKTHICFHGHTHFPRVFRRVGTKVEELVPDHLKLDESARYFINAGSVGQPRDGDPRACYVIHDFEHRTVTFRRVGYDWGKTQRKILDSGLPPMLAERLAGGL